MRYARPHALHGLVLALLALPLCLVLLELAARLMHSPEPLRRVYDPFAYRIPHPNLVDRFTNWEGEEVSVRLNELGMRGPPAAEPFPDGGITLVFLGGSTTENYAWNRADTFPDLVGRGLHRRLGRPVRVFNAGMSAATSSTSLARFQHQVLGLEPSLVVVMHAVNDLVAGFHSGFRTDGRHLPQPPGMGWAPRSYLWDWVRSKEPAVRERRPTPRELELSRSDYSDFIPLDVFRRNLSSLAAIAQAHRVPTLFLTQGSMYRETPGEGESDRFFMVESLISQGMTPPDVPSLARGMKAFNQAVLDLPSGPYVSTFDLAAQLAQTWVVFYDDCHLTRQGNRQVAAELEPVMAAVLQAPRTQRPSKPVWPW